MTLSARALVLLGPLLWGFNLMAASVVSGTAGQSFLHNVNLPFHEAGHILFRPFGQCMASPGGTLGQLLMPAICTGVLLAQARDPFGAPVALWWFSQNCLDVAPYINDASAGVLPLVGATFRRSAP